jgi:phosphatidylserine/phosphatidylglycerophosphate/cardiolipin synthase-like enzyme
MAVYVQVKKPLTQSLRIAAAIIVVFICVGLLARFANRQNGKPHETGWQVFFSPGGGCANAIVQKVGEAKDSVFVQAYSFTSEPIAKALADAKKRGVTISVILDKDQQSDQYSEANFLGRADIRTLIDGEHAINHNKVMVIDGETVITGSFNFTMAAEEKNAENLLIIRDKALAQRYTENWYVHAAHSKPFVSR